jgi:hypothetical protein
MVHLFDASRYEEQVSRYGLVQPTKMDYAPCVFPVLWFNMHGHGRGNVRYIR